MEIVGMSGRMTGRLKPSGYRAWADLA